MSTSKALEHAAQLIEKVGWIQGQHSSEHGFCTVAAIQWAARDDVERAAAEQQLADRIRQEKPTPLPLDNWSTIVCWNDDPFRIRDDVLQMLRGAMS